MITSDAVLNVYGAMDYGAFVAIRVGRTLQAWASRPSSAHTQQRSQAPVQVKAPEQSFACGGLPYVGCQLSRVPSSTGRAQRVAMMLSKTRPIVYQSGARLEPVCLMSPVQLNCVTPSKELKTGGRPDPFEAVSTSEVGVSHACSASTRLRP
jgi:hypothetical protein